MYRMSVSPLCQGISDSIASAVERRSRLPQRFLRLLLLCHLTIFSPSLSIDFAPCPYIGTNMRYRLQTVYNCDMLTLSASAIQSN